jgi:O-antigen/teichoic acid export membrane protein
MVIHLRARQAICRRPLLRNTSWLLAGQGVGIVLQAVYFILLARLLGASEYGIFIGAFAFTSIVAQYSSLGSGMVLMRYVSGRRKLFSSYWGNVVGITLVAGTIVTLVLHVLAAYLLSRESASLVTVVAFSNCICAQLITEAGRACRAFEKMRITASLNLLTNLLRTSAVCAMLFWFRQVDAWQWAVATAAVTAIGAAIAITVVTFRFGCPRLDLRLWSHHAVEGFGYSFAQSTTSIYNDVDKTMLSSFGLNVAAGVYTVAYRVIDIATIPITSLHDAALPRFFQAGRNSVAEAKSLAYRLVRRLVPVSALIAISLLICASFIPRFLGESFAPSVAALRWLCLIPLFRSIHNITGAALTGAGLQRYRTGAQVIAAGFNFAVNLWLIPHFGWKGAALASLATDGLLAILNVAFLQKTHTQGSKNVQFHESAALS